MTINQLYEKYNVLSDGLARRYVQDVFEKKLDMDGSSPIQLVILIGQDRHDLFNRSWIGIIADLANLLQEFAPKSKEELLGYSVNWTKSVIYSETKKLANMALLDSGLYLNVNHGAIHSTWLIGELLELYGVKYGRLIVHRPCRSEPQEIVDMIKPIRMDGFREYLLDNGVDNERANKIVSTINGPLNKALTKISGYRNDFYLFDSTQELSNYKSKLLDYMVLNTNITEGQYKTAKKYLGYLTEYFTGLMKQAKNNVNKLELKIPTL